MSTLKLMATMTMLLALCFAPGCESSGDSGGSGPLGGTWKGTAAGRPLTLNLKQNGTALSGSYKLENPDFSESLSGTASSETAPASATLNGGADRQFKIAFSSENSLSGGFYKGATQVGSVSASK